MQFVSNPTPYVGIEDFCRTILVTSHKFYFLYFLLLFLNKNFIFIF